MANEPKLVRHEFKISGTLWVTGTDGQEIQRRAHDILFDTEHAANEKRGIRMHVSADLQNTQQING